MDGADSMNVQFVVFVFIFIFGLLIGSFLNVCIYRIPRKQTVVRGRSYCPHCNALIPWYCNIPLLSFIFLGGKCKSCKQPISWRYPAIELLTGVLFVLTIKQFGITIEGLLALALIGTLVIISLIDWDTQIIPNGFVVAILLLGAMHALYQIFVLSSPWYIWPIGFFAASGILFLLGLLISDSIGGGDIKLMAASGLFLGPIPILLALFLGAVYAGFFAVYVLIAKKGTLKTAVPFGPFLSLGIFTALLYGEIILSWYLGLFT
jgi:leader peptidase (prepilin peptidase)/N-methyltransferase